MKNESAHFMNKARRCLANARKSLAAGLNDDAGRSAYLAAFHTVQAYIFERTAKAAKTHHGVQSEFHRLALNDPKLDRTFPTFLTQAYNLKAVADYETGPDSEIPHETSAAAIKTAATLVEQIAELIDPTFS